MRNEILRPGGPVDDSMLPEPPAEVRALGRDGSGRIWLGGSCLWVLDLGEGEVREVPGIPLFPGANVVVIAEDPQDAQGVIASLGDRGVLFVRFEAPAASAATQAPVQLHTPAL